VTDQQTYHLTPHKRADASAPTALATVASAGGFGVWVSRGAIVAGYRVGGGARLVYPRSARGGAAKTPYPG
jgi:hypothetical protein